MFARTLRKPLALRARGFVVDETVCRFSVPSGRGSVVRSGPKSRSRSYFKTLCVATSIARDQRLRSRRPDSPELGSVQPPGRPGLPLPARGSSRRICEMGQTQGSSLPTGDLKGAHRHARPARIGRKQNSWYCRACSVCSVRKSTGRRGLTADSAFSVRDARRRATMRALCFLSSSSHSGESVFAQAVTGFGDKGHWFSGHRHRCGSDDASTNGEAGFHAR